MAKLSGYRKLIKWIRVGDDFIKASTETRAESVVMTDGTTLADRNGISDNSIKEGVDTVAGLKGFYYKAVDKTNKIIYLTNNRLYDGSNYYYSVLEVLSGYYFTADIENWTFGGTWLEGSSAATSWKNGALKRSADKAGPTLWSPKPLNVDAAKADYVLLRVKVDGATEDSTVIVQVHVVDGETPGWKPYSVQLTEDILAEGGYYEVKLDLTGINTGRINQIGITQWYDETTGAAGTQTFYMDSCEIWDLDDDTGASKKLEEDLYYSENAVGKLLSVCNSAKFENSLRITKVESGKIYYELVGTRDPFGTSTQITELDIDDFAVWCHDCYDEGIVDLGVGAHAEGDGSKATNRATHAEGHGTTALTTSQHVQGNYNVVDESGKYAHIVGNGTSDAKRSNAHTLDWEGNAEYAGDVIAKGCGGAEPVSLIDVNAKLSKSSTQLGEVSTQLDNLIKQLGDIDTLMRKSACTFDAETGTFTLTL